MKDNYQDTNNQDLIGSELEDAQDSQHKREVKKR